MIKVPIKPFSQNKARQGRQFKTKACEQFMEDFAKRLLVDAPRVKLPDGELEIHFLWGFSYYTTSDYDNPIKTAQDVIADHYRIDDNRFVGGSQRKVKVKRGEEFIAFVIRPSDASLWAEFTGLEV